MIGGLFLDGHNSTESTVSIPYIQDDFTWCIQSAKKMPWIFSPLTSMSPSVWFILIFGCGYGASIVLFVLVQFDLKYKMRNSINWHYATFLIALPTFIGMGQTYRPISWKIRVIYGLVSWMLVICSQTFVGYFMVFCQIRFSMHQTATIREIVDSGYELMGSVSAESLITLDDKVICVGKLRYLFKTLFVMDFLRDFP